MKKNPFRIYFKNSDGIITRSKGTFASWESAHKRVKWAYSLDYAHIVGFKIVNENTNEIVEADARF